MMASLSGHLEVIKCLVENEENKAEVDAKDGNGVEFTKKLKKCCYLIFRTSLQCRKSVKKKSS